MPVSWPANTATPPPGWHILTDTNGTQPMGWFTTARDGIRTVVRGYPSFDDAPFDIPGDCRTPATPDELDHDETDMFLRTMFDLTYRGYVLPDVDTAAGPASHSYTNLDFCGGWRTAVGWGSAAAEALLARTVAGDKPASLLVPSEGTHREHYIAAAHEAGLHAVPYTVRPHVEHVWIAPTRLAERVDREALTGAWQALLDADPDPQRRGHLAPAVLEGLSDAFEANLSRLGTPPPGQRLPFSWWDESTDEGLVVLGAVLGYPPATTYALLVEAHDPIFPLVADAEDTTVAHREKR